MKNKLSIIIFISFISILFFGLFTDTRIIQSPLIGQDIPTFNLTTLHSQSPIDSTMIPKETVLVNVWASWCLECIREHQLMMKINKDKKIKIIGINYKDERDDAIGWLEIYGNPYAFSIHDYNGQLGIDLGVYGVPETFLIDKQGIILHRRVGILDQKVWEKEFSHYYSDSGE